jgi:hypothetical protein
MTRNELATLIAKAQHEIEKGNLDSAERLLDFVNKQADEEDDLPDDYDPEESNPSLDAADDEDDGEDDDSVDKALRTLKKAGTRGLNFGQINTDDALDRGRGHTSMGPVEADEEHSPETYRLSTTDAVGGTETRHKFTDKVDRIAQDEKVGRNEAMTRARIRHPQLYSSFQSHTAAQSTKDQAATRGFDRAIGKRGDSYEMLVSEHMAKGCNMETASQRVAQLYGYDATRNTMYKGESVVQAFESKVNALIRKGYDGETACRIVRQAEPTLFKALQVV